MQIKSFSVGIDIGGTNTAIGLVNRRGEILEEIIIKTTDYQQPELLVGAIDKTVQCFFEKYDKGQIVGIGIGAPNANVYTGEIEVTANLPWREAVNFTALIRQKIGLPTAINNDANATALGEMAYGVAKGMKDFIVITLGTGVGSGIVSNGKPVYGHRGFAGEIGHVIVQPEGRVCGCGRKGCLETYASATGIVRTAEELLEKQQNTHTHSMPQEFLVNVWKQKGCVSSKQIYHAALMNDSLAIDIFEITGKILGRALANAVAYTEPQAFILFGGLAQAGDFILQPTRQYMEENLLFIYKNKVSIIASDFTEKNAALLGASALAWELES